MQLQRDSWPTDLRFVGFQVIRLVQGIPVPCGEIFESEAAADELATNLEKTDESHFAVVRLNLLVKSKAIFAAAMIRSKKRYPRAKEKR